MARAARQEERQEFELRSEQSSPLLEAVDHPADAASPTPGRMPTHLEDSSRGEASVTLMEACPERLSGDGVFTRRPLESYQRRRRSDSSLDGIDKVSGLAGGGPQVGEECLSGHAAAGGEGDPCSFPPGESGLSVEESLQLAVGCHSGCGTDDAGVCMGGAAGHPARSCERAPDVAGECAVS